MADNVLFRFPRAQLPFLGSIGDGSVLLYSFPSLMASYSSSCPPVPLTAEYVAKQRKAVASLLSPPPWKWPLTHAERIQELVAAKNDPNYTPQYENLDAAIRYHMSFTNQDRLCSSDIVWFQGGKRVGAPYQDDDQRPAWNEVCN